MLLFEITKFMYRRYYLFLIKFLVSNNIIIFIWDICIIW